MEISTTLTAPPQEFDFCASEFVHAEHFLSAGQSKKSRSVFALEVDANIQQKHLHMH